MADKRVSPIQSLEDEMVEALARDSGLAPAWARKFVEPIIRHLLSEYGGERLYIPKRRDYDVAEVLAAFAMTNDVERTCDTFGISRRTLFRLLPAPE